MANNQPIQHQNMKLSIEHFENASFYPCSGLDGYGIRLCNEFIPELKITNHILVDFHTVETDFINSCNGIRGYKVTDSISLDREDLAPNGWVPTFPPTLNLVKYQNSIRDKIVANNPYAYQVRLKRLPDFNHEHGPSEMNLIFISGEAIATFQVLQQNWQFKPRVVIVKSAGWGWGFGYEDFREQENSLLWSIRNQPNQEDLFVVSDISLEWDHLELIKEIEIKHPFNFKANVFKLLNNQ